MTTGTKTRARRIRSYEKMSEFNRTTGQLINEQYQDELKTFLIGKDWSGADDKAWKSKVLKGQDATNSYDVTFYKGLSQLGYLTATYKNPTYTGSSYTLLESRRVFLADLSGQSGIDLALRSAVTNRTVFKMYNKLHNEVQSIDSWAFLGELRETIHGIRHPAESLAKLIETYHKKVILSKKRFAKQHADLRRRAAKLNYHTAKLQKIRERLSTQERKLASNLWLEFRFGIQPLAGDIASAAGATFDYLNDYHREPFKVVTARDMDDGITSVVKYVDALYEPRIDVTTRFTRTTKVKLVAIVDLQSTYEGKSSLQVLKSRVDLDLANVIPALWDLTPLSVFVDYFVNINDVLSATCKAIPKLVSVQRRVEETVVGDTSAIITGSTNNRALIGPKTDGFSSVSKKHYLREKYVLGIPPLMFTTPLSSPIKLGNLVAFFNNAFK